MKITFYGFIKDNKIVTDSMDIEKFYDPDGLVAQFNNCESLVKVGVNVFLSRSKKLITLVEKIEIVH